jgi:hypothetical protein
MKVMKLVLAFFGPITALAGCGLPVGDEQIDGPYRLFAADNMEQMHICYDLGDGGCIGRIAQTVFAVGWDESHIVAARHPNNDRSSVEYFYIVRADDGPYVDPTVTVRGPFDAQSFDQEKQRLGLPELRRELAALK